MEKGDILTVVGGLVLVITIALIANPQYLAGIMSSVKPTAPTVTVTVTPVPTPEETLIPILIATPEPVPTPTPILPDAQPYRIFYTNTPFSYPRYKIPDHMETYGASNIPPRNQELVPFAFIEETRGGLTQKISVPYPVWGLNMTVNATRNPQYGDFRMVICYASNGKIIDGAEILNRGTMYRSMEVSNTDIYLIITTQYIDQYRIDLETPRTYYDLYRPR